ncbi:acyltransferase [Herbidospora galbida]|uniref:Acyltransferase n=1 Tax=Herbidospora galbida TaxID=2575442 RepID=A0A4U3MCP9_9ACTN|nr:acyltransferase family protein [Herbidospora galbida]TKK86831.1 acyltransferase [Herbidospora galbida]
MVIQRTSTRRPELDLIRIIVVFGLIFFHAALVFDAEDDFYVKNAETTSITMILAGFMVIWAMPMLFLVAGVASWHVLRRRTAAGFAGDRLLRLGVPLLVAVVTIIPIPQWIRAGTRESYWEFLPKFFDVHIDLGNFPLIVRGDHFETGHLYFVVMLIAWSLILALIVRWMPSDYGFFARRGLILLPFLPISLVCAFHGLEEEFAAWSRWAYLLFFLYGYILAADDRLREAMRRDAPLAAGIGAVLFAVGAPSFMLLDGDPMLDMGPLHIVVRALYGAASWCICVALLGFLDRREWSAKNEGYLARAALFVYVVHQPVVVVAAYYVVRWQAPILVKYAAIVAVSFAVTLAAYEVVRRIPYLRELFGARQAGRA